MNDTNPNGREIEFTIFSVDPLVCQTIGWRGKPVSVIVDRAAGVIHFQNCHTPRKFLAIKAQSQFSCPLADLQDGYRYRKTYRGNTNDFVTIVTSVGKAHLSSTATNYESLCGILPDLIPPGSQSISTDHPVVLERCAIGALVGAVLGISMITTKTSDSSVVLHLLVSIVVGATLPFVATLLTRRMRNS